MPENHRRERAVNSLQGCWKLASESGSGQILATKALKTCRTTVTRNFLGGHCAILFCLQD